MAWRCIVRVERPLPPDVLRLMELFAQPEGMTYKQARLRMGCEPEQMANLFCALRDAHDYLMTLRWTPNVENGGMLMEVWRLNDAGYTAFRGVIQERLF